MKGFNSYKIEELACCSKCGTSQVSSDLKCIGCGGQVKPISEITGKRAMKLYMLMSALTLLLFTFTSLLLNDILLFAANALIGLSALFLVFLLRGRFGEYLLTREGKRIIENSGRIIVPELSPLAQGNLNEKIEAYENYLKACSDDTRALGKYLGLLREGRRYERLIELYRVEIGKKPGSPKVLYELSNLYFLKGNYREALEGFEVLLEGDKYYKFVDYDSLQARRGICSMELGDLDRAYTLYRKALPQGEAVEGLSRLEGLYEQRDEFNKAKHCRRLIEANCEAGLA